jgi:branched-chain amino acid transport system ATP-binding protein
MNPSTSVDTPALHAEGLSVGHHGRPVLTGVDLSVLPGEMVAVFGANGAGKTTLLLTLAGALPTLAGRVLVAGDERPRSLFQTARRGVALLTDDRGVFSSLSVRDNLGLGRGTVAAAVQAFPELEEHLGRRVGLLSGGQQQMVALARILAAEPRLILADELSLGLAPMIVRRLLEALRAAAQQGAAVVLVEQHVPVALAYVDRAVVLARGRVAIESAAGDLSPELVAEHYLSASTAS